MSVQAEVPAPDAGEARTILVVAAMRRETAVLRQRLDRRARRRTSILPWAAGSASWRIEQGCLGDAGSPAHEVVVAHCGIGPNAVEAWLDGRVWQPAPGEILLVGFAGGLDPQLRPGAVVWPSTGAAADPGAGRLTSRWQLPQLAGRTDASSSASLWSVKRPLLERSQKRKLWDGLNRPPLALVDMETARFFEVLVGLGVAATSLAACRVVTDAADDSLPEVVAHVRADGSIAPARLLSAFVHRPSTLPSLIRLAVRARRGSRLLADAVMEWLED